MGKTSALTFEITLPGEPGRGVGYRDIEGVTWSHTPTSPCPELSTETLWRRLVAEWPMREGILAAAGAELGDWLFDSRATTMLSRRSAARKSGDPNLRIHLRVPRALAEIPWEIASLEGVTHLAVHPALSVVRFHPGASRPPVTIPGQLTAHVIGVSLEPRENGSAPPLDTGRHVETVRREIEDAKPGLFHVETDFLGDWQKLVEHYRRSTPPTVFHFAGHGLPNGGGLVFRGNGGKARKISPSRLATLLGRKAEDGQILLAFLNACHTSSGGKGRPSQPFGGVGDLLIQAGIPMVVGLQTPVKDSEAQVLSKTFYQSLARGDSVDCAVQQAREELFVQGNTGVGWAFLNLTSSGPPGPLCDPRACALSRPSARHIAFGHEKQRLELEHFIDRRKPLVVVVHGEDGAGHRHVLERVRHDLERAGKVLWRPVAEGSLNLGVEPLLRRSLLAGGLAATLNLATDGTQEELEERIARAVADRCAGGRVLIVDLVDVPKLYDRDTAGTLRSLVTELWVDLMLGAREYRRDLPVFLLLAVAYPRLPEKGHRSYRRACEVTRLTEETLHGLAEEPLLDADVRVEVLPRLEPFSQGDVERFLERTLDLDPKSARIEARRIVELNDNETILRNLKRRFDELADA